MTQHFILAGEPRGKERPRVANGHAYTPQRTRDYEKALQHAYISQTQGSFSDSLVQLRVIAWMGIPKATKKSVRAQMLAGEIKPTRKPDVDNILKIVADALNGFAYTDDKQVNGAIIEKRYSDIPVLEVWITDEGLNSFGGITCGFAS